MSFFCRPVSPSLFLYLEFSMQVICQMAWCARSVQLRPSGIVARTPAAGRAPPLAQHALLAAERTHIVAQRKHPGSRSAPWWRCAHPQRSGARQRSDTHTRRCAHSGSISRAPAMGCALFRWRPGPATHIPVTSRAHRRCAPQEGKCGHAPGIELEAELL